MRLKLLCFLNGLYRQSRAAATLMELLLPGSSIGQAQQNSLTVSNVAATQPYAEVRLRAETAVTVKWIAGRLQMGAPSYVNYLLYRRRKGGRK